MANYYNFDFQKTDPEKAYRDKITMRWVYFFSIVASVIMVLIISNIYGGHDNSSDNKDTSISSQETKSSQSAYYPPGYSGGSSSDKTTTSSGKTESSTNVEGSMAVQEPTATQKPAQEEVPKPAAPQKPSIESQKTASGLTYDTALDLCTARLENHHGYELNAVNDEQIKGDSWSFELEGFYEGSYFWSINEVFCTVSGTEASPRITSFRESEYDRGYYSDDGDYYDYEDLY